MVVSGRFFKTPIVVLMVLLNNIKMKTWIGSDFHWGHSGIMRHCPETRGHYRDVQDMNEDMCRRWQEMVSQHDTVYMLGDIAFMSGYNASKIISGLPGRKILIIGNHDKATLKDVNFRKCFAEIHHYLEAKYNGHRLMMMHYPLVEWNMCHHGAIHFHGHLHQNPSGLEQYRARNVGWDYTGRFLSTMEEMIADAMTGQIKKHGNGEVT